MKTRVLRWLGLAAVLLVAAGCAAPVTVEWSTETEMNTAGFNLYRGTSAEGPFDVKVNTQLIPPAADPLTGGKYNFTDRSTRAGTLYYYELQEVERTGTINTHGPIAVRAGGLAPWHVAVLVVLGVGVVALWFIGGRRASK